jgi:hypothetical protein
MRTIAKAPGSLDPSGATLPADAIGYETGALGHANMPYQSMDRAEQ